MRVFVLLTVKNRKELTLRCLKALKDQTFKDIQAVVVDDGSTDGTSEAISNKFPDTIVLKGDGNLWWTGCMRLAVGYVMPLTKPGDFILCQNDDTQFGKDFVETLIALSEKHGRMILGTVAKDIKDKKVVYTSHKFSKWAYRPVIVDFTEKEIKSGVSFNTDILNTRGTLVPIEVFNKLKNFAKYFPHYAADYDFFARARKAGFKIGVATNVITYITQNKPSLAQSIKSKKKNDLKDFKNLFFFRKSSNNLYSSTLFIILHNPGIFAKVVGLIHIYLYVLKFIAVNMVINNIRYWNINEK